MKPKTKLQKLVVKLSAQLPKFTEKHRQWAIENVVDRIGLRLKKGIITCTHCSEVFPDTMKFEDGEIDICPNCGSKLKIETTTRKNDFQAEYFCIITTCQGFQVFRYFMIKKEFKFGCEAQYKIAEVVQRWLLPDGRFETFAKLTNTHQYYIDAWCFESEMELRGRDKHAYNVGCEACYPVRKYLSVWRKYGFKGKMYGYYPFNFFHLISTNNQAETLLKACQFDLLCRMCAGYDDEIKRYWPSIKICMRNHYSVKDAKMWLDYLMLLSYYKKDLRNAHYVCPVNLRNAHDEYMNKRNRELAKERAAFDREKAIYAEQRRKRLFEKMKEDNLKYQEQKGKFFDVQFNDGVVVVRVLRSVEEFKEEGDALNHCVFTNEYYKKTNSLVLSARIGDKHIETIEINLTTMTVNQCYGHGNNNTKYHNQILELVKKNMNLIRCKLTA